MKVIRKRKPKNQHKSRLGPRHKHTVTIYKDSTYIRFTSMGSPCEVIVDSTDSKKGRRLAEIAVNETKRIEYKFSRYRKEGIIYDINTSGGRSISVDEETSKLLDFSKQCFDISEGLFDITSGIFRKAWSFSPGATVPTQQKIESLLPLCGWQKIEWSPPSIRLLPGMEIDFGGICKEYAVDRTALLFSHETDISCLINYGGDIYSTGTRKSRVPWNIGITQVGKEEAFSKTLQIKKCAIATSGDMHRKVEKGGKLYSHIINPKTGWPVEGAPRSVTVLDSKCIDAGLLATLALLQGKEAESFLKHQRVAHWCQR
ncbi:MAG: FAD:protein FMN transferase [Nitrospinota bacterium]